MSQNLIFFLLARGSLSREREPLVDTAGAVYNTSRKATSRKFLPAGHSGLEIIAPDAAKQLSLPLPIIWIKHLYISWYDLPPIHIENRDMILLSIYG